MGDRNPAIKKSLFPSDIFTKGQIQDTSMFNHATASIFWNKKQLNNTPLLFSTIAVIG